MCTENWNWGGKQVKVWFLRDHLLQGTVTPSDSISNVYRLDFHSPVALLLCLAKCYLAAWPQVIETLFMGVEMTTNYDKFHGGFLIMAWIFISPWCASLTLPGKLRIALHEGFCYTLWVSHWCVSAILVQVSFKTYMSTVQKHQWPMVQ